MKKLYLFLSGQFVSQFGSKLTSYGLVLWAYTQTGSVLSLAALSISYLIPEIALNFIAGSISDRWDKKKVMLISDSIAALGTLTILYLYHTGQMKMSYLYVVNILLGITDAFQSPASDVTISLLITRRHYVKASAIQSFCNSFTSIFYPIVATFLYATLGLKAIFYFDLSSFAFAFITLVCLEIPTEVHKEQKEKNVIKDMFAGICYLKDHKPIMALILFMAFVNFECGAYTTNLTPMVLARNGGNNKELAVVTSMIGVAGLLGSFFVTKAEKRAKSKVAYILNIMLFSFFVCDMTLGLGRNYYVWSAAVFFGNLLIPIMSGFVTYLMRCNVPVDMQGRVFSARNTLQYFTIPIGNLTAGVMVDHILNPWLAGNTLSAKIGRLISGGHMGSGNAILYVIFALLGASGCLVAKKSKTIKELDD